MEPSKGEDSRELPASPFQAGLFAIRPERHDLLVALDSLEDLRAEEVSVFSTGSFCPSLVPLPSRERCEEMDWHVKNAAGKNLVLLSQRQTRDYYREVLAPAIEYLQPVLPEALKPYLDRKTWSESLFDPENMRRFREEDSLRKEIRKFVKARLDSLVKGDDSHARLALRQSIAMLLDFMDGLTDGEQTPWVALDGLPDEPDDSSRVGSNIFVNYMVAGPTHVPTRTRVQHALLGCACLRLHLPPRRDCTSHLRVKLPDGAIFGTLLNPPRGFDDIHRTRTAAHGMLSAAVARKRAREQLTEATKEETDRRKELRRRGSVSRAGQQDASTSISSMEGEAVPVPLAQTEPLRFAAALFLLGSAYLPLLAGYASIHGLGIQLAQDPHWELNEILSLLASLALPLALGVVGYAWSRPWVRPYAVVQMALAYGIVASWLIPEHFPAQAGVTMVAIFVASVLGILQLGGAVLTAFFGVGAPRHRALGEGAPRPQWIPPGAQALGRLAHSLLPPAEVWIGGIKSSRVRDNTLLREEIIEQLRSNNSRLRNDVAFQ